MRPARRRAVPAALVVLLPAALVALAACGGSSTPPAGSAGPTPAAVPTGPGASGVPAELAVVAQDISFRPTALTGPANAPFTIVMDNRDDGIPHAIALRAGLPVNDVAPNTPDVFAGEIVTGPSRTPYTIPGLSAGVYTFFCVVHPNMVGTVTLR